MARDDKKGNDEKPETPKKSASAAQLWFEEHWEGWIKPVGGILLILLAYALYKFDLVGEGLAGAGLVLAVLLGALGTTAMPAWPLVRTSQQRALFTMVVFVALIATGWPTMRAAVPPKAVAETRLTAQQPSAKVHADGNGPWELAVGGTFKQAGGEAEAGYTIKVAGNGSDEISGSIRRALVRVRTSRRGGTSTSVQERTENVHRLPTVRGSDLTITADAVDDQLADGLLVDVRPGAPNPLIFIIASILALIGALVLDARLTDQKGKQKAYLTVGVGICFAFAMYFPEEATPHSLVRPAVAALVFALAVGGLSGWLLGVIARAAFGPKIKKAKK
jgi:hypothetical protein